MAEFPHVQYLTSIDWDDDRPVFKSKTYDGTPHRRFKHGNKMVNISASYTFYSYTPIANIRTHYATHVNTSFTYWEFWEDADKDTATEITVWYTGKPKFKRRNSKVYTCTVKFEAVVSA